MSGAVAARVAATQRSNQPQSSSLGRAGATATATPANRPQSSSTTVRASVVTPPTTAGTRVATKQVRTKKLKKIQF